MQCRMNYSKKKLMRSVSINIKRKSINSKASIDSLMPSLRTRRPSSNQFALGEYQIEMRNMNQKIIRWPNKTMSLITLKST